MIGGAWINLGEVVRDRKKHFFSGHVREMEDLPDEVDYISLELHQILPSLFMVSMDVYLNKAAGERINGLQNSFYKNEIRFKRIIPMGRVGGGYNRKPAENVMHDEIVFWINNLRNNIELCLLPYVKGFFGSQNSGKNPKFPTIEIFALKGVPGKYDDFNIWLDQGNRWLESYGFNLFHFNNYSNNTHAIFLRDFSGHMGKIKEIPNRCIILWDSYIQGLDASMYGNDIQFAVMQNTKNLLSAILPYVSLIDLLTKFQTSVEKLRITAYKKMRFEHFNSIRLGKQIKMSGRISQFAMILERLSDEYEGSQKYILKQMDGISNFKRIDSFGEEEHKRLDIFLHENLMFKIKLNRKQLSFILDWFSQYLSLRNLTVTYILALMAAITALVSILLTLFNQYCA